MDIFVCVIAGILAGVGTGFSGLSAAVFISPMLVALLDVDTFEAIGIALASDVLASGISAITYHKHGNLDLKRSKMLFIATIVTAIVGSIVSFFVTSTNFGNDAMGLWTIVATILLGLKFVIRPVKAGRDDDIKEDGPRWWSCLMFGIYIGFVCGFQGTGGGMMLLFTLTIILGYEFKKAVGTSVFIMTFTALIGSISHFAMSGMPDMKYLIICIVATVAGAQLSAMFANKMHPLTLNRVTGVLLVISGGATLWANFFL